MLHWCSALSLLSCSREALCSAPQAFYPSSQLLPVGLSLPVRKLPVNRNLLQASHRLSSALQLWLPLERLQLDPVSEPSRAVLFLGRLVSCSACPLLLHLLLSLGKEGWTWLLVFTAEQRGSQGSPKRSPHHPLHSDGSFPFGRFFKLGFQEMFL